MSGSSNTSTAVSNSIPWFRRFALFLFASHSQINGSPLFLLLKCSHDMAERLV